MTNPLSRLLLTTALLAGVSGVSQAQWDYKTDVKRQISIYSMDCSGCDLSGHDYSRTKMKNSKLSGAILNRVNFSGATIYNSDLSGAHLKKSFLVRVKGEKVIFKGAILNNATMTEIELKDSDFQDANLGATEFRKAIISGSNFKSANLGRITALGAKFENCDMSKARFNGANLMGTSFTESIFSKAAFGTANLKAVDFTGAKLSGAKMASVEGLTQEQLDKACGDGKTELPVNLTISYCTDVLETPAAHDQAAHDNLAVRDREIIVRTERALRHTEALMKQASPEGRRSLQRIHADLLAIQRKVENE